ncbi:unnamed protein product [Adineta steineri]|uniref:G-protein coupled receptors family 1 profile domain-containing protein n=2 Tax=Adineta steineri TaxID=433720 RepID=A0A815PLD6_9BILA|nr:unnamed protein product [Adineta steineri]
MVLDISSIYSALFLILLTITIPSIICSVYIFYHFVRSRELRKRLNNHVILVLILLSFIHVITDMPIALIVLHTGFVPIQTTSFCLYWAVYNYSACVVSLMLMAYGCVERYFLVFHRVFFKKHLILLHYGPIAFCIIYPTLLYIGVIIIYPCQNNFDYTKYACGGPCYQFEPGIGLFDWFCDVFGPVIVGTVATMILIIRIIVQKHRVGQRAIWQRNRKMPGIGLFDWFCDVFGPVIVGTVATMILIIRIIVQKHRVGQRAIWQRNRKMVIQLASLSAMYIAVWTPDIISFVIPIIVPNPLALDLASNVFCYFEYFAALLCPFACLVGLPEVRQSMRQIFIRFNTIQPSSQNPVEFLRPLPQCAFGK